MSNNRDELRNLISNTRIGSISSSHAEAIRPKMLSLHRNVLLVNDRIWVPKTLITLFSTWDTDPPGQ